MLGLVTQTLLRMTLAQLVCALGSERLRLPTFLMVLVALDAVPWNGCVPFAPPDVRAVLWMALTTLDVISWTRRTPITLAPLGDGSEPDAQAPLWAALIATCVVRLWLAHACRPRWTDWLGLALYVCYRGACGDLNGYGLPFLEVAY